MERRESRSEQDPDQGVATSFRCSEPFASVAAPTSYNSGIPGDQNKSGLPLGREQQLIYMGLLRPRLRFSIDMYESLTTVVPLLPPPGLSKVSLSGRVPPRRLSLILEDVGLGHAPGMCKSWNIHTSVTCILLYLVTEFCSGVK